MSARHSGTRSSRPRLGVLTTGSARRQAKEWQKPGPAAFGEGSHTGSEPWDRGIQQEPPPRAPGARWTETHAGEERSQPGREPPAAPTFPIPGAEGSPGPKVAWRRGALRRWAVGDRRLGPQLHPSRAAEEVSGGGRVLCTEPGAATRAGAGVPRPRCSRLWSPVRGRGRRGSGSVAPPSRRAPADWERTARAMDPPSPAHHLWLCPLSVRSARSLVFLCLQDSPVTLGGEELGDSYTFPLSLCELAPRSNPEHRQCVLAWERR